jgi:diguanylate cyclase (GGDEF)-like protein/PAS domain S-box-containing protein
MTVPLPSFKALVERSLVGVYIVQDGRLVYANPKLAELFGYEVHELLALPSVLGLVADEDRDRVTEMLRRRLAGEVENVHYQWRGRRRDGSVVEFESLSGRCEFKGRPAVSGTILDVTGRLRAERELSERDDRLRQLIDLAQDVVFTWDVEGRITTLNTAGEQLLGFAPGDAIGRSMFELLPDSEHERVRGLLAAARGGARRLSEEVPLITRGGTRLLLEVNLSGVERNGITVEIFGIARDVTARRRQEEALRTLTLVDELTGLYNRRGFQTLAERHLALAIRKGRGLFLLFCDLDELKQINDTWGHREGDRALTDTAHLLRHSFRSADIIARLGGDEFTVFPLEASDESGDRLIRRLAENVEAHNASAGRPYRLAMSVGIARFEPGSAWTIQQLLEEADRRLYADKRRRRA